MSFCNINNNSKKNDIRNDFTFEDDDYNYNINSLICGSENYLNETPISDIEDELDDINKIDFHKDFNKNGNNKDTVKENDQFYKEIKNIGLKGHLDMGNDKKYNKSSEDLLALNHVKTTKNLIDIMKRFISKNMKNHSIIDTYCEDSKLKNGAKIKIGCKFGKNEKLIANKRINKFNNDKNQKRRADGNRRQKNHDTYKSIESKTQNANKFQHKNKMEIDIRASRGVTKNSYLNDSILDLNESIIENSNFADSQYLSNNSKEPKGFNNFQNDSFNLSFNENPKNKITNKHNSNSDLFSQKYAVKQTISNTEKELNCSKRVKRPFNKYSIGESREENEIKKSLEPNNRINSLKNKSQDPRVNRSSKMDEYEKLKTKNVSKNNVPLTKDLINIDKKNINKIRHRNNINENNIKKPAPEYPPTLFEGIEDSKRKEVKKLIYNALVKNEKPQKENYLSHLCVKITNEIEKELFVGLFISDDANKSKYIKKAKHIIVNLANENNMEFKERVLNGEITSEQLISMKATDMAPSEIRKQRKLLEQKAFYGRRIDTDFSENKN